ncbi:MAG: type II toxin-antitoxin system prevent-host-death family antitoxin [Anaerolineales bacterium]|jgi:prevent-host-death family protein|nr:type II toxin-antitoxin system prevent-host-death family antitoxin [Chloroflexota bacterium]MBK6648129.1 type II toxin-antitoxin system prevent-host-death family antitoxin [Anaerolineales bacterium]MCC6986643.1 type II toxin-antitoxin system prevent-host-death family antitoxin [Anaerolineales bacterium]
MTEYRVGVRDLKTHLSAYLEKVQKGHTVIITFHGKPIAQLTPTREELMDRVRDLQKAGLIAWSGKKPSVQKPKLVNSSDILLSDLVVELRQ